MALRTAAIAMGNQTADRPFFVSANVVSGSCFSVISQCNCLISKLLQEHSKGSFGKKNTPFFLFYNTLRRLQRSGHEMYRNSEIPHILAEQQPVGRRVELKQEPVSPSSD